MKLITYQCPLNAVSRIDAQCVYWDLKKKWPFGDTVSDEHIGYALIYALNLLYHDRLYLEFDSEEWIKFVSSLMRADLLRDAMAEGSTVC